MANVWEFVVVERRRVRVDFTKDVTDEREAVDLYKRGHFAAGYTDDLESSFISAQQEVKDE